MFTFKNTLKKKTLKKATDSDKEQVKILENFGTSHLMTEIYHVSHIISDH